MRFCDVNHLAKLFFRLDRSRSSARAATTRRDAARSARPTRDAFRKSRYSPGINAIRKSRGVSGDVPARARCTRGDGVNGGWRGTRAQRADGAPRGPKWPNCADFFQPSAGCARRPRHADAADPAAAAGKYFCKMVDIQKSRD
jgi:hypothetical protein